MNYRDDESSRETMTQQPQTVRGEIGDDTDEGFLPDDQMSDLRDRWGDVQASFVDDPRTAVQEAHELVTTLVNELTDTFTRERTNLESQWNGNGQADTEALRIALQRYRSFFNRLLGSTNTAGD